LETLYRAVVVFFTSTGESREFLMASALSSKGQVTIPKRVRDSLGLKPGMQVQFTVVQGYAILEPLPRQGAEELAGALRKYAVALRGKSHRRVLEEARREVAHDAETEGLPARRKRSS
jgi:AbrB family looped-hinge helix DNA binding protein